MSVAPSILVIRFGALGDVVLTTPFLRALRSRVSDARITFATKRAYAPLIEPDPHVDNVVSIGPGDSLRDLARRLAKIDHVLDLHGSLRSSALRRLLKAPHASFDKGRRWRRLLIWTGIDRLSAQPHVTERYFAAGATWGLVPDGGAARLHTTPAAEAAAARLIPPGAFVVLAPGASHRTKRWPPGYWNALARRLRNESLEVVGTGLPGDRVFEAGSVIDGFGVPLDIAAAMCGRARAVVANDSGLLHVAAAVGTPVIAIYGPTVPGFGFTPLGGPARIAEAAVGCRPCSSFGGSYCPAGHHRCLRDVSVDSVASHLEALL